MDSICFASIISQCRVTILRLRQLGNPNIAGPFVSLMKNVSGDHMSWLYLHWSWMVPIRGIMVLLYAVKMVFDCLTKFFGGFGHIFSYNRYGNTLPSATVSTFTISFAVFLLCLDIKIFIFVLISVQLSELLFLFFGVAIVGIILYCMNIFIVSPLSIFCLPN